MNIEQKVILLIENKVNSFTFLLNIHEIADFQLIQATLLIMATHVMKIFSDNSH